MKNHATIDEGKAMKANAGLRGLLAVVGGTLLLASLRRRALTGVVSPCSAADCYCVLQ